MRSGRSGDRQCAPSSVPSRLHSKGGKVIKTKRISRKLSIALVCVGAVGAMVAMTGCEIVTGPEYPAAPGDATYFCEPAAGDIACAAGATKICKQRPLRNIWKAEIAGSDVYRAEVQTSWCWRGNTIVSRHTDPNNHYVTSYGHGLSLTDNGVNKDDSYCTDSPVTNYTCVTQYQYGFTCQGCVFPIARVYGGCVATRIWGASHDPNHPRHAYGGTCLDLQHDPPRRPRTPPGRRRGLRPDEA
jgi:hypothetical protein